MAATPAICVHSRVAEAEARLRGGEAFGKRERDDLVGWLLAHQNPVRGFVYFPTEADRATGLRLLTGEKPRTKLLGENAHELETLRLLSRLAPGHPEVEAACAAAETRLRGKCFTELCWQGECAGASLVWLRYRLVRDPEGVEELAGRVVEGLRDRQIGAGRRRGLPVHYTRLVLSELPRELARDVTSHPPLAAVR